VSDAAAVRALSWQALWRRLGAGGDPAAPLAEIERRYAEPGRHYHTLAHLDACLDTFEVVRGRCERPDEAELALWLHDLIWTPLGTDNEERSAAWAVECCRAAGLPDELGARVAALILATRHDGAPLPGDAAVVADVDLAILGASYELFDRYEAAIRAEYASVPDAVFREGRARILRAFLTRPVIFTTPPLQEALELRARENLVRSLARLGPAIHPGPL
jgi:predicted metal-dependent HD superfamily phosphohydrolase